jgi:ABC-type tungstate transport system substrate-binding protein
MNTILTQENINLISTALIVPLIIVIARYFISYIEMRTKELTENIRNEKLKKYLDIAEDAVKTAVIAVSQVYPMTNRH